MLEIDDEEVLMSWNKLREFGEGSMIGNKKDPDELQEEIEDYQNRIGEENEEIKTQEIFRVRKRLK